MKYYDGQPTMPDPYKGTTPMYNPDGTPKEALFIELGGTITEDAKPTREQEFEEACAGFRTLCAEIGEFIGDPSFTGGFEEYAHFADSEAYRQAPVQGNALAIRWSAMNELCKYMGARAGYGQPDWWCRCWEYAERV